MIEPIDWNSLLTEIVKILPNCFLIGFIILLAILFHSHLQQLFARLTRLGAFGLEVEFSEQTREQLERAIRTYATGEDLIITEERLNSVLNRAKNMLDDLRGARILWVDRTPLANANIHRFLNDLGVVIDNTDSTDQAVEAMRWSAGAYEVVITNMKRAESNRAGLELIARLREQNPDKQIILFVSKYNPAESWPPGVRLVTNEVDTLLHHVFDAISLERSKKKLANPSMG